jgi:hypothetical protein
MHRTRTVLLKHLTTRVGLTSRLAAGSGIRSLTAAGAPDDKQVFNDEITVDAPLEEENIVKSSAPELKAPGKLEQRPFAAEVSQLLQIVAHSLYTDKEVFVRELVSNACDALEKLRFLETANESAIEPSERPLQVEIDVDTAKNTITIRDHGLGFSADQLVDHLGTIARSGSKAFLQQLKGYVDNATNGTWVP